MDFQKLKKALAKEAKAAGICEAWHEKILNANSRDYLLELFIRGVDFATLNDFPSDALADEFKDIAPHFGIFINQPILDRYVTRRVIAREAKGAVTFDGYTAGEVYALRGADVQVTASANAYVAITVENGAKVQACAQDNATILISPHGGAFTATSDRPDGYKVLTSKTTDNGN